jgi:hypothetical protein
MCLILDANRFGEALSTPPSPDYRPIIDWLTASNSAGMVVFGGTKFLQEIARSPRARQWFLELQRAGRAKSIDRAAVDAEEKAIRARGLCFSDDEHLVALARKSARGSSVPKMQRCSRMCATPRCYRSRVVVSTARSVTLRSSVTTPVASARPSERDDPRPLTTVPALGSAISR